MQIPKQEGSAGLAWVLPDILRIQALPAFPLMKLLLKAHHIQIPSNRMEDEIKKKGKVLEPTTRCFRLLPFHPEEYSHAATPSCRRSMKQALMLAFWALN